MRALLARPPAPPTPSPSSAGARAIARSAERSSPRWPLACALGLSACGSKQDVISASRTKPFTVMLDFFPNADHAALYSAIAHGDFRAVGLDVRPGGPREPGRTAEAAGRGQGGHGDLL